MERGYKDDDLKEKVEQTNNNSREILLHRTQNVSGIPLTISYNRSTQKVSEIMKKHWYILKINRKLANIFEGDPIISFKWVRDLREIIGGGNTIINNNVRRTKKKILTENVAYWTAGKTRYVADSSRALHLSQATEIKRLLKAFIILLTSNRFLICLMECVFCNCSMWENQNHHLICASKIKNLTYLIEMRSPHVVILSKTNIDSTNMQNLHWLKV